MLVSRSNKGRVFTDEHKKKLSDIKKIKKNNKGY